MGGRRTIFAAVLAVLPIGCAHEHYSRVEDTVPPPAYRDAREIYPRPTDYAQRDGPPPAVADSSGSGGYDTGDYVMPDRTVTSDRDGPYAQTYDGATLPDGAYPGASSPYIQREFEYAGTFDDPYYYDPYRYGYGYNYGFYSPGYGSHYRRDRDYYFRRENDWRDDHRPDYRRDRGDVHIPRDVRRDDGDRNDHQDVRNDRPREDSPKPREPTRGDRDARANDDYHPVRDAGAALDERQARERANQRQADVSRANEEQAERAAANDRAARDAQRNAAARTKSDASNDQPRARGDRDPSARREEPKRDEPKRDQPRQSPRGDDAKREAPKREEPAARQEPRARRDPPPDTSRRSGGDDSSSRRNDAPRNDAPRNDAPRRR